MSEINIVIEPLISKQPIELQMTVPGPKGEPGDPTLLIDDTQALTDKTYSSDKIETELSGKVDNSQVLTDVPSGAVFTDDQDASEVPYDNTASGLLATQTQAAIDEIDADLDAHKAESVMQVGGAHGLKVESGTFTPSLVGSTVAGANTYSKQKGFYYKIGNIVYCDIFIALTAKDGSMAGDIAIGNLPFTSKNTADKVSVGATGNISYIDMQSGYTQFSIQLPPNSTKLDLQTTGSGIVSRVVTAGQIKNNSIIICSISYEI